MQDKLNLPDYKKIKYVDLLDTDLYYTGNGVKSHRHAINDNLLGNHEYCPFIRRSPTLEKFVHLSLDSEAKKISN
jgi:hypothetical protein